jgi:hypothetical protein
VNKEFKVLGVEMKRKNLECLVEKKRLVVKRFCVIDGVLG